MSSAKRLCSGAFSSSQRHPVDALDLLSLASTAGRLLFGAFNFGLVALITGQSKFLTWLDSLACPRLTAVRS